MSTSSAPAAPAALMPLVDHIAKSIRSTWPLPRGMTLEDLVSEGTVGLLEACRRYDGTRGVGLAAYAGHRIRGAMLDALRRRYTEVHREVLLGDTVPPGTGVLAEEVVCYHSVLREKVAALSRVDRALVLGRLEDESFAALGRRLGLPKVTAFHRYRRVLARLRTEITDRARPTRWSGGSPG